MSEQPKNALPLVNRVANSGILVFNLEDYYPKRPLVEFDLKPYLFKELILKEKDFRAAMKEHDWSAYKDQVVLVYNSNDAIIPVWAYMLISAYLKDFAEEIFSGTRTEYLKTFYTQTLNALNYDEFDEKRVVIKGCSNKPVPASAYAQLTSLLKPHAQSIMYGEPCSTVPIFKRPRKLVKKV